MKKTIKTITTAVVLTLILGLSSCKKGDTGPAGSQGTAGTNGSANVQSFTVTTNNASWGLDGSNSYTSAINVTAINSSVLNGGTIQVFIGDGTSTEWGALPFSYSIVQYNYSYKVGQVLLSVSLSTGAAPSNPGGQQFKIVVIPPAKIIPNVNIKNYEDVKKAYNLVD